MSDSGFLTLPYEKRRTYVPPRQSKSSLLRGRFDLDLFLGKKMPRESKVYYPLKDVCEELGIGANQLLRDAAAGGLGLFVKLPPEIFVMSGHEDAVQNRFPSVNTARFVRGVKIGSEKELEPVHADSIGIFGFYLMPEHCRELVNGEAYVNSFEVPIRISQQGFPEFLPPLKGQFAFRDSRNFSEDGWRYLAYKEGQKVEFLEGLGFTRPHGFSVDEKSIYVLSMDLEERISGLVHRVFDEQILKDGEIYLSPWMSKKLQRIAGICNKCFSGGISEWKGRQGLLRSVIDEELEGFRDESNFTSVSNPKKIVEYLASSLLPNSLRSTMAPSTKLESNFSDEVQLIFVVAKKFWGNETVDIEDARTHPRTSQIIDYFKLSGCPSDEARSYATLIRPEDAARRKSKKVGSKV